MISTARSIASIGIALRTVRTSLMWPSRTVAVVCGRSISCIEGFLPLVVWRTGGRIGRGQAPPLRTLSCSNTGDRSRWPSAGRAKDRRVDRDRHRPAEEMNQHLHALGRVQGSIEDGIDHRQRAALDDQSLAGGERQPRAATRLLKEALANPLHDAVGDLGGCAAIRQDAADARRPVDEVPAGEARWDSAE